MTDPDRVKVVQAGFRAEVERFAATVRNLSLHGTRIREMLDENPELRSEMPQEFIDELRTVTRMVETLKETLP
jgi:hypothetical protein